MAKPLRFDSASLRKVFGLSRRLPIPLGLRRAKWSHVIRDPVDLSAELAKAKAIINRNFRVLVIINRETGETQDKS